MLTPNLLNPFANWIHVYLDSRREENMDQFPKGEGEGEDAENLVWL